MPVKTTVRIITVTLASLSSQGGFSDFFLAIGQSMTYNRSIETIG